MTTARVKRDAVKDRIVVKRILLVELNRVESKVVNDREGTRDKTSTKG